MKYQKINPQLYTAEKLLDAIGESNVLLEVRMDKEDMECYVLSYAHTYRGFYTYMPSHVLAQWGKFGEEKVNAKSSAEWTERFLDEDTYISIYNDYYCQCEYEEDIDQIKELLTKLEKKSDEIELYLSDDRSNFQGPLECNFITWWIKNHPGYHTDTIR